GIRVTPEVDSAAHVAQVQVETWQTGGQEVVVEIEGLPRSLRTAPNAQGRAETGIRIENCRLWDGVDDPYLYTLTARLLDHGVEVARITTRFGCRTIGFDAEKGFLLNGRPCRLFGAARHQDRQGLGSALTDA